MVSLNVTAPRAAVQQPPVVAQLQRVFDSLDDVALLEALQGPARRGPKGYSVKTLWHCFVAKYVLGLGSTATLLRTLRDNPFIAEACGIPSPDRIPHEATFSRFFLKLSKHLPRVKDVSRAMTRKHYATLPGFGERVALDSTTLKAWSNGGKTPKTDPEAGWSIKMGTQGTKELTYGWKLHLLVDCEYELPIAANISAGNVHDSQRASNVLREARSTTGKFHPSYVMADAAYSSSSFLSLVKRQYRATPVVKLNAGHKRLLAQYGVQNTLEGKTLLRQRQSVERVFSRLKGQRSLNHITVRRVRKVTAHCYLALIAMQSSWRQAQPTAFDELQAV